MGHWQPPKCRICGYVSRDRSNGNCEQCKTCNIFLCGACRRSDDMPRELRRWRRMRMNWDRCRVCLIAEAQAAAD